MFDQLSDRTRMVIFLARVVAAYRGASEICDEHLLEGIIREDAPTRRLPPYSVGIEAVQPHHAFFADSRATELLTELNSLRPSRDPIQTNVDMAVSSGLGRTLNDAAALANDLRSTNIEPLHLLAAMIQSDADICERLNRHGVRLDAVLAAIRSTDQ
jgi:ATP-dependent Clp protease ATP-binding subunit ClpA